MDILSNIDQLIGMLVAILVAVEAVVTFFLSPEKAEKFAVIGKVLDFLRKTKSGFSTKVDKNGTSN